jgi:hypothetical protein
MCVTWDVLEKRLTVPIIPHLWYKGIGVIFLFSAFYFFPSEKELSPEKKLLDD